MASVDHTSRAHALLSASGASRWLNCTPSARIEERFTREESSIYAEEGTLAHEFGDVNLRFLNGEISKRVLNAELKKLRKHERYTDEMEMQVDKYVTLIWEEFQSAKKVTPDAQLLIEERSDFSHLVEQGYGTNDACIISDDTLIVGDLKYGKGVQVFAENNPQLRLYASGALRAFEMLYDIEKVRMIIVQPRLNHVSIEEISAEELRKWGQREVKPKAQKAWLGKGKQQAGDWCKWCKAKPMCATLAAKNIKLAQHEFRDPHLLTEEQLLDVFKQQPMLVDWVKAVHDYILNKAKEGKQWPGYKLVEGRSVRRWKDETEVLDILYSEGFEKEDVLTEKIKGITAIEKLVGKQNFTTLLGPQIIKPAGAPTLVPETDKRPAITGISAAIEDFS